MKHTTENYSFAEALDALSDLYEALEDKELEPADQVKEEIIKCAQENQEFFDNTFLRIARERPLLKEFIKQGYKYHNLCADENILRAKLKNAENGLPIDYNLPAVNYLDENTAEVQISLQPSEAYPDKKRSSIEMRDNCAKPYQRIYFCFEPLLENLHDYPETDSYFSVSFSLPLYPDTQYAFSDLNEFVKYFEAECTEIIDVMARRHINDLEYRGERTIDWQKTLEKNLAAMNANAKYSPEDFNLAIRNAVAKGEQPDSSIVQALIDFIHTLAAKRDRIARSWSSSSDGSAGAAWAGETQEHVDILAPSLQGTYWDSNLGSFHKGSEITFKRALMYLLSTGLSEITFTQN